MCDSCDMTHLYEWIYAWHDSFVCVTCVIGPASLCNILVIQCVAVCESCHTSHTYKWDVCNTPYNPLQHAATYCATYCIFVILCVVVCSNMLQRVAVGCTVCCRHLIYVCDLCDMTHIYEWLYAWHDSYICVTLHRYLCDMTHAYVWFVWRDLFVWVTLCVTWLICMCDLCDMTHIYEWLYVWHDSYICVTLHRYLCDMTNLYEWFVWHDSYIWMTLCVTWLICMCDST